MPKVSVIIPVYNAEQFLKSCLDSVLSQTINDLEILCTDDGSSDASLAILQEYSEKDKRVRFFCQENKGAGPARNLCLANAHGEYVVFMDSDDSYPEKETLELLYNAAKANNCPIVAGYRSMLTEMGIHDDIHDPLYKLAQDHTEGVLLHYRDVQYDFNYQCYFFQRSLLVENDITFPDYRRCQDPPFLVRALIAADTFFLLPIPTYVYRWGHQNIQWNKRKINDLLKAHIDLLQMSRTAQLEKLHKSVASRLEGKYKDIIVSNLKHDNLELFALLVYANSITDFEWLKANGAKERKSVLYGSVTELAAKMANIVTIRAAGAEDCISKCIDEISGYYETLPNADIRMLNDVLLCVLAQLYDNRHPYYIRKQLSDFVVSSKFTQISNRCNDDRKEVIASKEILSAIQLGFSYWSRLQNLRKTQTQTFRRIYDSTTEDIPKVSVIVPVFNVERYVAECLQSLLVQTCRDIEIICVDDGSTDSSLDIVMRYAQAHPNFVVLQQPNSGLSMARNTGLKVARGEYIHFLDSDDFVTETAYELLLEKALPNRLDLLFFDGMSFYEDENLKYEYPWYESGYTSKSIGDTITDGEEYFLNAVIERDFRISACMYLVRREFLEQHRVRFLPGIVHEDNYFTYVCALLSQRTSHLSAALYNRRVCRGSITIREKRFRHAYGYFHSYMALREFLDHAPLSQTLKDIASLKLMDMLKNARNEYEKIVDKQELQYYLALPTVESEQFYLMVVDPVQRLKARTPKIPKPTVRQKEKKSDDKILKKGNIVRRGVQCCKDHGVWYTVKYSFKKLRKKIRGGIQCCKDHGIFYTIRYAFIKLFKALV